jgi:hypothetical protein
MAKEAPVPKVKDEPGAQERFDRAIKNALATPARPHKATDDAPLLGQSGGASEAAGPLRRLMRENSAALDAATRKAPG